MYKRTKNIAKRRYYNFIFVFVLNENVYFLFTVVCAHNNKKNIIIYCG